GELDWIVMKALEKDRNRRYETANGFALDVLHYLADEPVLACPPSMRYRFRKFVRQNRTAVGVAGLVLFFLTLLGSSVGWMVRDREAREQEIARDQAAKRARLEQEIVAAIEETESAYKRGRMRDALAAIRRAAKLVDSGEASDILRQKVE